MEIKYDTPIQVTERSYNILMREFGQIIAGRKDESGNYFIKLWVMSYKEHLNRALAHLEK